MTVLLDKNIYSLGQKNRDMSILARFLSLIESSKSQHQKVVTQILTNLKENDCAVIGISGTPGAGKSTFINQLGLDLIKDKKKEKIDFKLAIIAIDPSSEITGGSILGDKTRMGELAAMKNVFIRPIASKASFGGVTPRIELMISALKAWKFDLILIETVGVGQTESTIRSVVDNLILVVPPGTGDDLQAMKRGLLELVDVICINKIDQSPKELVNSTFEHYKSTIHILRSKEIPIFLTNATTSLGMFDILKWIKGNSKKIKQKKNANQIKKLFFLELQQKFSDWINNKPSIKYSLAGNKKILKEFGKYLSKE